MDSMAVGALASSLAGALTWVRWRHHRLRLSHGIGGPLRLAEAYMCSRAETARERERRATIIAVITALPPGASLVDRRADGASLTVRIPMASSVAGPSSMEQHRVAC